MKFIILFLLFSCSHQAKVFIMPYEENDLELKTVDFFYEGAKNKRIAVATEELYYQENKGYLYGISDPDLVNLSMALMKYARGKLSLEYYNLLNDLDPDSERFYITMGVLEDFVLELVYFIKEDKKYQIFDDILDESMRSKFRQPDILPKLLENLSPETFDLLFSFYIEIIDHYNKDPEIKEVVQTFINEPLNTKNRENLENLLEDKANKKVASNIDRVRNEVNKESLFIPLNNTNLPKLEKQLQKIKVEYKKIPLIQD